MEQRVLECFELEAGLKKEVDQIVERLMNITDADEAGSWEELLQAKQLELEKVTKERESLQTRIKNDFINNIRKKSVPRRDREAFKLAKQDAYNTVFEGIAFPAEVIADMFSTDHVKVHACSNSRAFPAKLSYEWEHTLTRFKEKVVPLSPHVEPPTRWCPKKNQQQPVFFMLDTIYQDRAFQRRVAEYYKQFNLSFSVTLETPHGSSNRKQRQDQRGRRPPQPQTFVFRLSPMGEQMLIFP